MKFFDELVISTQDDTEKQVFETTNEIINKINDVRFIGVADVLQMASEAVNNIDKKQRDAVVADLAEIRQAIKGLGQKLTIENDIKLRNGLAELVNSPRFITAMQKIIEQGQGSEQDKQQMRDKLSAFIEAQKAYKGYGALSPRDLALIIQMIETAIEAIYVFLSAYRAHIQVDNIKQLEQLRRDLEKARKPIVTCAIELLELNDKQLKESRVNVSGLEGSFINVSQTEPSPQDLAQFWTKQLNNIIVENTKNPKLMQLPQMIQHLDDEVPLNPFSLEDNKKEESTTIRNFLMNYVEKHAKENIVIDMRERGVLARSQTITTIWERIIFSAYKFYSYAIQHWKNAIGENLSKYFLQYFPNYFQGEANKNAIQKTKPLSTYIYHKLEDTMDKVWKYLGYPIEASHVVRRYRENTESIRIKYQQPDEKAETKPQTEVTPKAEIYEAPQPIGVKRIEQITDKNKQKKLEEDYVNALAEYQTIYASVWIYDNKPHINLSSSPVIQKYSKPNEENISVFKYTAIDFLIRLAKQATDIKLDRKTSDNFYKQRAKHITDALEPLIKTKSQDSNYEKLLKDTLRLCLSYSDKFINPASQRVQAINWLYYVMDALNKSNATDEEKLNALAFALNKVGSEAQKNHYQISFFGQCGFTNSKLHVQAISLLEKHDIKRVETEILKDLDIKSYKEFITDSEQSTQQQLNK